MSNIAHEHSMRLQNRSRALSSDSSSSLDAKPRVSTAISGRQCKLASARRFGRPVHQTHRTWASSPSIHDSGAARVHPAGSGPAAHRSFLVAAQQQTARPAACAPMLSRPSSLGPSQPCPERKERSTQIDHAAAWVRENPTTLLAAQSSPPSLQRRPHRGRCPQVQRTLRCEQITARTAQVRAGTAPQHMHRKPVGRHARLGRGTVESDDESDASTHCNSLDSSQRHSRSRSNVSSQADENEPCASRCIVVLQLSYLLASCLGGTEWKCTTHIHDVVHAGAEQS